MNILLGIFDLYFGATSPSGDFNIWDLINTIIGSFIGAASGLGTAYYMFIRQRNAEEFAKQEEMNKLKRETYDYFCTMINEVPKIVGIQIEAFEKFHQENSQIDFIKNIPELRLNTSLKRICEYTDNKSLLHSFTSFYANSPNPIQDFMLLTEIIDYNYQLFQKLEVDIIFFKKEKSELSKIFIKSTNEFIFAVNELLYNNAWCNANKEMNTILNNFFDPYFSYLDDHNGIDFTDYGNVLFDPFFAQFNAEKLSNPEIKNIIILAKSSDNIYSQIALLDKSFKENCERYKNNFKKHHDVLIRIVNNAKNTSVR